MGTARLRTANRPRRAPPTDRVFRRPIAQHHHHNDSPDIPFRHSINPYRGCEHGCAYCYARPGHETLGLNAGLDFETKVFYKPDAPALLRAELCKPSWKGEIIAMSGVTDCYQPAERRLRITRGCIEVMAEAQQAFGIITKNALVVRDLDLLAPHAAKNLCAVNITVTTLDADLVRCLEPRTSSPEARLRAIRELTAAGIPVRVMVAPIIPGLTDTEIPAILQAVADSRRDRRRLANAPPPLGGAADLRRLARPQPAASSASESSPESKTSAAAK